MPGNLYNPGKDEFHDISEAAADEFFLTQCPCRRPGRQREFGLPGIGPVKAKAILGPRPSWDAVETSLHQGGFHPRRRNQTGTIGAHPAPQ